MTAAVLPLPTTRRTLGARRPVARREDFTVLRGGAGGDRALHLIDLENLCGAGSTPIETKPRAPSGASSPSRKSLPSTVSKR